MRLYFEIIFKALVWPSSQLHECRDVSAHIQYTVRLPADAQDRPGRLPPNGCVTRLGLWPSESGAGSMESEEVWRDATIEHSLALHAGKQSERTHWGTGWAGGGSSGDALCRVCGVGRRFGSLVAWQWRGAIVLRIEPVVDGGASGGRRFGQLVAQQWRGAIEPRRGTLQHISLIYKVDMAQPSLCPGCC